MALNNQALLIITISSLLLSFSAEAYSNDPSDPSSAPALQPVSAVSPSAPVSYISSTPDASPASSPSSPVPLDLQGQASQFVTVNMLGTKHKTEEFIEEIKQRLNDPATSSTTKQCLEQCQEVFDSAVDDIKNTIEDLESGNYYKAGVDISAVSTNVDTCEQCFEEMIGEDPKFKKFDDWVRGITGDCLGALNKLSS